MKNFATKEITDEIIEQLLDNVKLIITALAILFCIGLFAVSVLFTNEEIAAFAEHFL